jgi:membrane protein implicated in regulation of membrane protease activity
MAGYVVAWIIAAVAVAVLGWPWLAEIAVFAVLFGAGLVLWERRRRHD